MINEIELSDAQLEAVNGACGQEWECHREENPCDDDRRFRRRRGGEFYSSNESESDSFDLSLHSTHNQSSNSILGIF